MVKFEHKIDHYAVFGHPISHSKSPTIHKLFAEQTNQQFFSYTARDVPAEDFNIAVELFFSAGGKGLNCTVPLKQLAWRLSQKKSERAELSKAVNTLAIQPDGSLYGDNTDGIGLINDLIHNLGFNINAKKILLLGAGGASRGILKLLLDQQPSTLILANRTVSKAKHLETEFSCYGPVCASRFEDLEGQTVDLIINATAASLHGEIPPLPDDVIKSSGYCYDLAYDAKKPTPFVTWGKQHNAAKSVDGLGMLVEQAAEAFALWRGIRPETAPVIAQLNSERGSNSL